MARLMVPLSALHLRDSLPDRTSLSRKATPYGSLEGCLCRMWRPLVWFLSSSEGVKTGKQPKL